jgi:3-hydroxyisobutyrate dehydrogenase
MGGGMGGRLLGAGFPLTVYNRSPARAEPLVRRGARQAATPREAAADADVVLSMVSDDEASREMWSGGNGALAGVASGRVLVECSTVSVARVHELAEAAAEKGCEFLDAPVTGTRPHAAAGELVFLVGGDAVTLERVRPVLAVMSRAVVHAGPSGSGARLKLINNFMAAVQAASFAEALAVIEKSGLNRDVAVDVLTNGAPGSPLVKTMAARMTGHEYMPPNFAMRLMAKDIRYASGEAAQHGVPLQTGAATLQVFERAIAEGYGDADFAAIVEPLRAG